MQLVTHWGWRPSADTILQLLFLSSFGWIFAAVFRRLLRRGIQITYLVPMSPEAEDRMLQRLQAISVAVLLSVGLFLALRLGGPAGISAAIALSFLGLALLRRELSRSRRDARRRHSVAEHAGKRRDFGFRFRAKDR